MYVTSDEVWVDSGERAVKVLRTTMQGLERKGLIKMHSGSSPHYSVYELSDKGRDVANEN